MSNSPRLGSVVPAPGNSTRRHWKEQRRPAATPQPTERKKGGGVGGEEGEGEREMGRKGGREKVTERERERIDNQTGQ